MPTAEATARAIARKSGLRIIPSPAQAANLLGLSTQVPTRNLYLTDGRSRTLRIGPHTLYFHHVEPATMAGRGRIAPLVQQALRDIGRRRISDTEIRRLRRLVPAKDRQSLLTGLHLAPIWMQPILREIARSEGEQNPDG